MTAAQKVQLARWFNARGIRMMKCAGHVESCGHYKAFKELADAKFGERDRLMRLAREELGKPVNWRFEIEESGKVVSNVLAFDELSAGAEYEACCECIGAPVGDYRVVKRRDRL